MLVFGFDMGTGSLGAVIREDNQIIWAKSWKWPADFASTKAASTQRRARRTRTAHRARESWWNQQAKLLGIPVLKEFQSPASPDFRVVSVDPRLTREFPKPGDETIYTSCLLRVMILEGRIHELEDWQIYKAVHSAIQKRGYGHVPWATNNNSDGAIKNTPEKEDEDARTTEFNLNLENLGLSDDHRQPGYFEAHAMGLWRPESGIIAIRQDHKARPAETVFRKGYTAPREKVETELSKLLTEIKKRYPALDVEFILNGPGLTPYASYYKPSAKLPRGKETDWQGLLGQKIPRFDNRIVPNCCLIRRLHAARAQDKNKTNRLWSDVHLMMRLHNLVVREIENQAVIRKLRPDEFRSLFESFRKTSKATSPQLRKQLQPLKIEPALSDAAIPEPKGSGRTSFSRPALKMLAEIYMSGTGARESLARWRKMPISAHSTITIDDNKGNNAEKSGLVSGDLAWLMHLAEADTPWEKLHIPSFQLEIDVLTTDRDQTIHQMIGENNNPVVRHRLQFFVKVLAEMSDFCEKKSGKKEPDRICMEFVREDFMPEKKKKALEKFQKERREENQKSRDEVKKLDLTGNEASRKYQLWERQNFFCLYTNQPIPGTRLGDMEIDHIVPRAKGGPDAFINLMLTTSDANKDKGDRTPFEWLSGDKERWAKFVDRIESQNKLSKKTRQLCMAPDAAEQVKRYTDLAATAWIARKTQGIVHVFFGWDPPESGAPRRFEVISGGLTASVRWQRKLNSLLNHLEEKKNRDDPRHHILDAMVISFMKASDRVKNPDAPDFVLPDGIRDLFKEVLDRHIPTLIPEPPQLEENFYGLRDENLISKRFCVLDLAYNLGRFSLSELEKQVKSADKDNYLATEIKVWLTTARDETATSATPEKTWRQIASSKPLPNGTVPRTIAWPQKKSEECKILAGAALHGPTVLKPKGSHKGYFVIAASTKQGLKYSLLPVYAFESKYEKGHADLPVGAQQLFFFRAGDTVELVKGTAELPAGLYQAFGRTTGVINLRSPFDPKRKFPMRSIGPLVVEHGIRLARDSA